MKHEFEARVKIRVTLDEYKGIEALYMDDTSSFWGDEEKHNKNVFCQLWLQYGGIQKLLDARQERIEALEQELEDAKASEMRWVRDFNRVCNVRDIYQKSYYDLRDFAEKVRFVTESNLDVVFFEEEVS